MMSDEEYWAEDYRYRGDPRKNFASRDEQDSKLAVEAAEYERRCKLYGRLVDAEKTFQRVPEGTPADKMQDKVYSRISRLEQVVDCFRHDVDFMLYARSVMSDEEYWAKRQGGDNKWVAKLSHEYSTSSKKGR